MFALDSAIYEGCKYELSIGIRHLDSYPYRDIWLTLNNDTLHFYLANEEGYKTFVVPDDVGGRFSVFSAVGLVPLALVGIDIDEELSQMIIFQQSYAACAQVFTASREILDILLGLV